jgi:cobalt-zinc-cadmium resistance protein CzcA
MIEKVVAFALRNRLLVLALALLVICFGYYSYVNLPVDAFPDVSPNLVQVYTVTEGLAPEEIERYVTYPIEASMNGLPGIVTIRSVSNFGLSVVNVYFEDDMDIYFVRRLVDERLQEAKEQIPEGFGEPQMGPISTGMGLAMFYYLEDETGTRSLQELRDIQDWLVKFHLQTVPGVTEVLGIGGYEKQYHVLVRPDNLLRYDVSLSEILEKIRANNLNVGAQFIERNSEELIVRSVGLASTIEDIENIVIKAERGTPIYLGQLATVQTGGAIRRGVQTRNGVEEVVAGTVIKLFGTNASAVIGQVEQKVAEINRILPEGIKIVPYYEQKTLVDACVKTVKDALIQGIILVILILAVFLGAFRPSLVVTAAIPFSLLFATAWMSRLGISANLMSLGGLAIAIGMLVDGTIVVVENIDRTLRMPHPVESRVKLVSDAVFEVGRPILFAIAIIVIVFLPLFMLQGVEGKTFRPLANTVVLAMAGSILFTVLIAPAFSYYVMRASREQKRSSEPEERGVMRLLISVYRPVVSFFVARRAAPLALAAVLLALGVAVFPRLGSEFTPALEEGTIVLRMSMAPSISLEESKRVTMIVERRLLEIPEVSGVISRIGRGEVGAHSHPVNLVESYIALKDRDEWVNAKTQEELQNFIRKQMGNIPGVLANYTQPIRMTVNELLEGVRAELAVKLFGDDIDILKEKADQVAEALGSVDGAIDVQPDQVSGTPELVIGIDRQSIARHGINVSDVQNVISAAVGGESAGQVFEGVRRYDIVVRYQEGYRDSPEDIANIMVKSPAGAWIPLAELAVIQEVVGQRQITRENNQRFISIALNVVGRDVGTFVEEANKVIEEQVDLPPGYFTTWGGQFKLQQQANRRFAVVIPITLLLVLFLLYSNFRSLRSSILILLNIPLALVGGVVGLWVTGQNLSVPASVGFIALFGIALENGMVLVTYMNQLLADGRNPLDAAVRGASVRLRPVMMTAMTTGLGLTPLLFATGIGSEVQRPLAAVVLGGLITSTILTLLVIPGLYTWFAVGARTSGSGSA